jgi:hypothetical protein
VSETGPERLHLVWTSTLSNSEKTPGFSGTASGALTSGVLTPRSRNTGSRRLLRTVRSQPDVRNWLALGMCRSGVAAHHRTDPPAGTSPMTRSSSGDAQRGGHRLPPWPRGDDVREAARTDREAAAADRRSSGYLVAEAPRCRVQRQCCSSSCGRPVVIELFVFDDRLKADGIEATARGQIDNQPAPGRSR